MWGNIGNDISLFLCYERAAESTIGDFESLIPLPLIWVAYFEFCFLYGILLWALISCGILFWAMIFARGGGALFRMCRYICCGLIWIFRVQFVAAVSAKSVWYLGRYGWNLEIVCLIEVVRRLLVEQLSFGFHMNFHISARVSLWCGFYGWKTIIAYWRCVLQAP